MKKVLKITGFTLLGILLILLLAPILFKSTIEDMVKKSINDNINATVAWDDLSLNFFSSFPDARLRLENISVVNNAPFAGDTLVFSKEVALDMGILQLLNTSEGIRINELAIHGALINIKTDSLGNANYDIALESTPEETPTDTTNSSSGITFGIQHYEITDTDITYFDQSAGMSFQLKKLHHEGTGDFSAEQSTLQTQTKAFLSFAIDGDTYFQATPIRLDADLQMDFNEQKYTFLENTASINQLQLIFDGFVQLHKNNTEVDLTFKTPTSTFKNFLAVIPKAYSKSIENVTTSGTFTVNGKVQGVIDEQHIPTFHIAIRSDDAAFKYPDLPKKVKNISLKADLTNKTGLLKDTYLNLDLLRFQIDQDLFAAHGSIKNLTENMLVDMTAKGSVNLANLDKAYPLELDQNLNGLLKMDVNMKFDMASLEKENYQNVRANGTVNLNDFHYNSSEFPNPVEISKAALNFTTNKIELTHFAAKSGQSDAHISGILDNLMGFMFADQDLKGTFNLQSNTFAVNDFMPVESSEENTETTEKETSEKTSSTTEKVQIPSFLDVTFHFAAQRVLYDNLTLKNVKGTLILKDATARLKNVTSSIFNGVIGIDGNVSTQGEAPSFAMQLDLSSIDIAQSFEGLELLQNIAPIAKALQGTLNTSISLKGKLNNDLTPILESLAGNALAQLLTAKINPKETPLLSKLEGKLDFLNLDKLNLNDLKTKISFEKGNVVIQPFDFKIKDIAVNVSGKHSFANTMDYAITLDLPAKYLGKQLGSTLTKLSSTDLQKTKVELPIALTGTFTAPRVKVNTEKAVKSLSKKIVDTQKDQLKEKAEDALGNLFNKNETAKDSTSTDSTQTDKEKIKNAAENILGGLFGKKKKDSVPH